MIETPIQAAQRFSAGQIKSGFNFESLHPYKDLNGKIIYWRIRLRHPVTGEKWIRPMCVDGASYSLKEPDFPNGKPLYGQEKLQDYHGTVLVVEGELCVDTLAAIGIVAVTSGSSSSANAADWSVLSGRNIKFWPDNDDAGLKYAQTSTSQLIKLGCTIKWIDIDQLNLPEGGDIVDWLKQKPHANQSDIDKLPFINPQFSNTLEFSERKPLQRELPPAQIFPIDALGEVLGGAAKKMAEVIQAPIAICGQSILAAAALAVQGHADVVIDGRIMPLSQFFVTIGVSGERKSAVDSAALRYHREHQKFLKTKYESELASFEIENAAHKKSKDDALRRKTFEEKKSALKLLANSPSAPLEPFFIIEEPTYEGLVKLLAVGQPSVGLFTDEGGRFVGGHGMNQDNILKTAAGLSSLWDGKPISRVRAGEGSSLLVGRRVSFHLMLQPAVSQLMLANSLLTEQGLISRCLVVWPKSTAGDRPYVEANLFETSEMRNYYNRIKKILDQPFSILAGGRANELSPRQLSLSREAKKGWIAFHNSVEEQLKSERALAPIRGFANKAAEHMVRVAGTLCLIDNIENQSISITHIACAIDLVTHYLNEALRLFNAGLVDPDLVQAEILLQWLKQREIKRVTLVEVYQYGPNSIRSAQKARFLMSILQDHGWVTPKLDGAVFEEALRKEAWEVLI